MIHEDGRYRWYIANHYGTRIQWKSVFPVHKSSIFHGAMVGGSSLWCLKWSSISQCTIGWNPPPSPYDSGLCVNPKKTDWHSLRISQFLFSPPTSKFRANIVSGSLKRLSDIQKTGSSLVQLETICFKDYYYYLPTKNY